MQTPNPTLQHHFNRFVLLTFFIFVLVILVSPGITHAQENSITHVVKPGESLSSIATRYGTTVSAVARANGITNPNYVAIGQVLIIPVAPAPRSTAEPQGTVDSPAPAAPLPVITRTQTPRPEVTSIRPDASRITPAPAAPSVAPATSEVVHTVRSGETLSNLAIRYGTTITAIRTRNGLRSTVLLVGQRLIIPAGRSGGSTAPTQPLYRPATSRPEATPTSDSAPLPLLPTVESTARPGQ